MQQLERGKSRHGHECPQLTSDGVRPLSLEACCEHRSQRVGVTEWFHRAAAIVVIHDDEGVERFPAGGQGIAIEHDSRPLVLARVLERPLDALGDRHLDRGAFRDAEPVEPTFTKTDDHEIIRAEVPA